MLSIFICVHLIIFVSSEICQPYERLEEKYKCGKDGYLLSYGLKNCRLFNTESTIFSPVGKDFIACTTSCLLRHLDLLDKNPKSTCISISRDAFDSHTDCYIECKFCRICKTEKRALLSTYDLTDFFSFRAFKQVVKVASSCSFFGFSCLF